ncbi:hypothetical protein Bbelb_092930 [Branchiostoma belcheri]|nr:hypothetical protein Bbelb_092930 [Branchiostoma belcheri]
MSQTVLSRITVLSGPPCERRAETRIKRRQTACFEARASHQEEDEPEPYVTRPSRDITRHLCAHAGRVTVAIAGRSCARAGVSTGQTGVFTSRADVTGSAVPSRRGRHDGDKGFLLNLRDISGQAA